MEKMLKNILDDGIPNIFFENHQAEFIPISIFSGGPISWVCLRPLADGAGAGVATTAG